MIKIFLLILVLLMSSQAITLLHDSSIHSGQIVGGISKVAVSSAADLTGQHLKIPLSQGIVTYLPDLTTCFGQTILLHIQQKDNINNPLPARMCVESTLAFLTKKSHIEVCQFYETVDINVPHQRTVSLIELRMYQQSTFQFMPQGTQVNQEPSEQTIKIAVQFLKTRFKEFTMDEILLSLRQHAESHPEDNRPLIATPPTLAQPMYMPQMGPYYGVYQPPQPQRTRITNYRMAPRQYRDNIDSVAADNDAKLKQQQQIRFVARIYCNVGLHPKLIQQFFPDMTRTTYRSYIDIINRTVIRQVQSFLKNECNLRIDHISTEEKLKVVKYLQKSRDWMGKKNYDEFSTYCLFIERHYLDKQVDISYSDASKLYKLFLSIVRSPYVNVMDFDNGLMDQLRVPKERSRTPFFTAPWESYTEFEKERIIQTFLRQKHAQKTSQVLTQEFGMDVKWSLSSVQCILQKILKKCVKKIIKTAEAHFGRTIQIQFGYSAQQIKRIYELTSPSSLKMKLLKYFINKRMRNTTVLLEVVNQLNQFFRKPQPPADNSEDESLSLIKVEDEVKREARDPQGRQQIVDREQARQSEPKRQLSQSTAPEYQMHHQSRLENEDKLTMATNQDIKLEDQYPLLLNAGQMVIEID